MRLVQGMYANAQSRVRVGEGYNEEFEVKALSVALEWAATASSAMAASTGCTRNAVGSSA